MKLRSKLRLIPVFWALLVGLLIGCTKKSEQETTSPSDSQAQQIGDVMAAIDDSGGSDGGYVYVAREQKTFARLFPEPKRRLEFGGLIIPKAHAASCALTSTFGSCASNQIIRDFQGCTIGGASLTGTVTFSFDDGVVNNVCTNDSDGDSITRVPAFTLTGARGGTFTVSKLGSIGQRLTRTSAGVFAFSNDGIRRVLSYNGTELANYTTSTTSNITITGASRNGRIANGGALRVLNNLTAAYCDFVPTNVTWNGSCNCAISGNWAATCSTGSSASFAISGCGTGTLTVGTTAETVTLDQCSSI